MTRTRGRASPRTGTYSMFLEQTGSHSFAWPAKGSEVSLFDAPLFCLSYSSSLCFLSDLVWKDG